MSNYIKGCILAMLSGVLFGLSPIIAKFIYLNGGTRETLLFIRCAGFIAPLAICALKRVSVKTNKKELPKLLLAGVLGGALTPLCTLSAFSMIDAGMAITLHYLYCVLILLGLAVFFREKFGLVKILCTLASVAGVYLLYANTAGAGGSSQGIIYALASAVFYAAYSIVLEKSGLSGISVFKLQFYVCLTGFILISAVFGATGRLDFTRMNAVCILASAVYSLVIMTAATILYQLAVHFIGSQRTAVLSTFEPLTGVALGILLYSEHIDALMGVGMALVLGAAVVAMKSR